MKKRRPTLVRFKRAARALPPLLGLMLMLVLAAASLIGTRRLAAQTGPTSSPSAQARRQLTDNEAAVIAIGVLTLTIIPVILGIKAAKRKGVSPHWMWFGLHPVGGWIAYLIIRSRPDRARAPAPRVVGSPGAPKPSSPPPSYPSSPGGVRQAEQPASPSRPEPQARRAVEISGLDIPAHKLVNRGDRQDSVQQAMAYWMARLTDPVKDPFVMYMFDAAKDARAALLELPCVHEGGDGKLICTEPLIFGYYLQDNGQYEAVICGGRLTHELWQQAKLSFEKHGGLRKNDLEPERTSPEAPAAQSTAVKKPASAADVVFVREDRQPTKLGTGIATYRIYSGPDEASARAFLESHPVEAEFLYFVVETPEGNFGRDIQGIYQEAGSRPDVSKPSQPPAAAPMSDHFMFKSLADLCYAYQQNDRAAIDRLEPMATSIGQELNRRGGKQAMLAMWERLGNRPGSRTLDMHWHGIGEWQG